MDQFKTDFEDEDLNCKLFYWRSRHRICNFYLLYPYSVDCKYFKKMLCCFTKIERTFHAKLDANSNIIQLITHLDADLDR